MVSRPILGGVPDKHWILSRYLKTTVQGSDNCDVFLSYRHTLQNMIQLSEFLFPNHP